MIYLELRGDSDYYGTVYTGTGFIENVMVFNTMSQYTVLNTFNTNGKILPSEYEPFKSDTAKEFLSGSNQEQVFKALDFGPVQFQGYLFQDDMCLY